MSDAKFWDKAAPKYARDPIADPAAYEETLARMQDLLQPAHRVLELGCGTGSTALALAGGVSRYVGTDVSGAMIEIATAKLGPDTPPHLRFEVSAAGDLPDGPFDVILALNLLHLLPDLEAVVARVHAALPPGGLFISKTGLLRDGAWFFPMLIPVMRVFGKAPFVRSLRDAELRRILTDAGFEVTEALVQPGMVPRVFLVARKT